MDRIGILSSAFNQQALTYAQQEMHANGADQSDDRFAEWILGNIDRGRYSPEESRAILAALEREPRFQERVRQSREALGGNEWRREHLSGALDPVNLAMLMSGMGPAMMAGAAVERYTAATIGRFVANGAVRWLASVGSRIAAESAVLGTHAAAQEAIQTQSLAPVTLQNIETHAAHNAGVMGVFRGLGGLVRPFGVLASGAAQLGGFMALQAHEAPQSDAGLLSRAITAASEMARLRWVSGATNQATGGALHRLESEAAALREHQPVTGWEGLSRSVRGFGRQLALAPLQLMMGIPADGGLGESSARPIVITEARVVAALRTALDPAASLNAETLGSEDVQMLLRASTSQEGSRNDGVFQVQSIYQLGLAMERGSLLAFTVLANLRQARNPMATIVLNAERPFGHAVNFGQTQFSPEQQALASRLTALYVQTGDALLQPAAQVALRYGAPAPVDSEANPMSGIHQAVSASQLTYEQAMPLITAYLSNPRLTAVTPDVLNATDAALRSVGHDASRSAILHHLWRNLDTDSRARLLRSFIPRGLRSSEDFALAQSVERFIAREISTDGDPTAATPRAGSVPVGMNDEVTQLARDFRTAVRNACVGSGAPADGDGVMRSVDSLSDEEIGRLPEILRNPSRREALPAWIQRNAEDIGRWLDVHGMTIDRAYQDHADEAYRMREHAVYGDSFGVDEEGLITVFTHLPVQDIESHLSSEGLEVRSASLMLSLDVGALSSLTSDGIRNSLISETLQLPVATELPSNEPNRTLNEGMPSGRLSDRPQFRRLALRVRSEDVRFLRVSSDPRKQRLDLRPWSEFSGMTTEESSMLLPRGQFYLSTRYLDPGQIRVVPSYALTPLALR